MDSRPEAYGVALASHIMGWCPLLFDPQGAFLHMCNVSPAPRMGNVWPLDPLLKQGFVPLCSCHDCYLRAFSRDKAWLFTLFLWVLTSQRANRRQVVYVWPEAHLFLTPRNVNRRPVVNAYSGAHLFPASGVRMLETSDLSFVVLWWNSGSLGGVLGCCHLLIPCCGHSTVRWRPNLIQ